MLFNTLFFYNFLFYFLRRSVIDPKHEDFSFSVGGRIKGHTFTMSIVDRKILFLPADSVSFENVGCHPFLCMNTVSQQIIDYLRNLPCNEDESTPSLRSHYFRYMKGSPEHQYILKMQYTATITPGTDSGLQRYTIGCHKAYYKYTHSDGGPNTNARYNCNVPNYPLYVLKSI